MNVGTGRNSCRDSNRRSPLSKVTIVPLLFLLRDCEFESLWGWECLWANLSCVKGKHLKTDMMNLLKVHFVSERNFNFYAFPVQQQYLFIRLLRCIIYLPIDLSIYLPIYLPTYLPTYLSIYLPFWLSIYLAYLSINLPTFLPIFLPSYGMSNRLSWLIEKGVSNKQVTWQV